MRLREIVAALTLGSSFTEAFRDTSPLFLYSNADLYPSYDPFWGKLLAKASEVDENLLKTFANCPVDTYILVTQAGVLSSDYENHNPAVAHMEWAIARDESILSVQALTDVLGNVDIETLQNKITEKCGASLAGTHHSEGFAEGTTPFPWIYRLDFSMLPEDHEKRQEQLTEHDSYLHALITSLHNRKWVVVYTTTPPASLPFPNERLEKEQAQHPVQMYDFEDEDSHFGTLHMDIKRGAALLEKRQADNSSNSTSNAPLFEKYNFFTTGIYLGIFIAIILLSILYVGLSAIAGLEVSYAAFSKEMGPQAQGQKGKQQ